MIQTGNVNNHVDKSQLGVVRLVNSEGIIYPPAFYNYLTAWVTNDAMAYSSTMAEIHPETKVWPHDRYDYETLSKWTVVIAWQAHSWDYLKNPENSDTQVFEQSE